MDEHESFMRAACVLAGEAYAEREVPIAAILTRAGNIIATGTNKTNITGDPTTHAEIVALSKLRLPNRAPSAELADVTLYVTIEPCIMCAAALSMLGLRKVYFGARNPKFGGCCSVLYINDYTSSPWAQLTFTGGILEAECVGLLQRFYGRPNPNGKSVVPTKQGE